MCTYTEQSDPQSSVTVFSYGARWITLQLTFNDNRPLTSVLLYIRSVDVSDNFTLIRFLNSSDLTLFGENFLYNLSDGAIVLPQTSYIFIVVFCSEIGCSNKSSPSPIVTTLKDGN